MRLGTVFKFFMQAYTKLYAYYKNVSIGSGSTIYPSTRISAKRGIISIGHRSSIGRRKNAKIIGFFYPTRLLADKASSEITIGDNVCLNGTVVNAHSIIKIGNNCRIAAGTIIVDHNGHNVYDLNRTERIDSPSPIVIEDNVWIGLNSIILKGTQIGKNSVVAAGSVVKGYFPEDCIIQGNPAKVVKHLTFRNHE